jgi:hypothetical protein
MKNAKTITGMCLMLITGIISCTTDKDIKADIAIKAKSDINFADVIYNVEQGKVILSGNCVSTASKQYVERRVKSINVIKGITNNIRVAPVAFDYDPVLKQSVDSILATHPYIQAKVSVKDVILVGTAEKKEVERLLPAIQKLNPMKVDNRIMIL